MRFFVVFLAIFLSVLFGLHYYVLRRLSRIFEFACPWKVVLLVFFLGTANFIGTMIAARQVWNEAVRLWWIATVSYLGLLWIAFWFLLVYALAQFAAKFMHPIPARVSQYIVVVGLTALVSYSVYHARQIQVKTVEIFSDKLDEPVTIVQLTDLHLGAVNRQSFVERVAAQTNALNPDFVAITGDLLDMGASAEMVQGFKRLKAPAFFVWGNHDRFLAAGRAEEILAATPIRILKNEAVFYNDTLQIIGLDYLERQPDVEVKPVLTSLSPSHEAFTLLLSHAPVDFPDLGDHPIDLQLAGHTHSGQIFPFTLIVKSRYPRLRGLYTREDRAIYVSSGTGAWGPPMRLGTDSEITLIRLLPLPAAPQERFLVRQNSSDSSRSQDFSGIRLRIAR